jgi:DNA-binding CsgD family transcriptional regulator
MSTPVRASDKDLRALAGIVSQDRPDLPDGDGLPPSLLADLYDQIRCDSVVLVGFDGRGQAWWFGQGFPPADPPADVEDRGRAYWTHYRASQFCSYPARSGDLRSIIKYSDFYSVRQHHSTAMYIDCDRPSGVEHCLMLCLSEAPPGITADGDRHVRLYLGRGPGPDFSERDRALLVLLRPHLHQAYLAAEQRRHPVPRLTLRQNELLRLVAAGRTNSQIARQLGISEATVRTHLEHIYGKLGVSSRTAAVTRAFPDRMAQDPPPAARPADRVTLVIPARSPGRGYLVPGARKET